MVTKRRKAHVHEGAHARSTVHAYLSLLVLAGIGCDLGEFKLTVEVVALLVLGELTLCRVALVVGLFIKSWHIMHKLFDVEIAHFDLEVLSCIFLVKLCFGGEF